VPEYDGDPRNLSAGRQIGDRRRTTAPLKRRYIGVGRRDVEPVEEEFRDPQTGEMRKRWRVGPSYDRYVTVPRGTDVSDARAVQIAGSRDGDRETGFLDGLLQMFGGGGGRPDQDHLSTGRLPGGTPVTSLTGQQIDEAEADRRRREEMAQMLEERRQTFGRELAEDNMRFGQKLAQERTRFGQKLAQERTRSELASELEAEQYRRGQERAQALRERELARRRGVLDALPEPLDPRAQASFLRPELGGAIEMDQRFEERDRQAARRAEAEEQAERERRVQKIESLLDSLPPGSDAWVALMQERTALLDPDLPAAVGDSFGRALEQAGMSRRVQETLATQEQKQKIFSDLVRDPSFARAVREFEDVAYDVVVGNEVSTDDYMLAVIEATMAAQARYGEDVTTQDVIDFLDRRVQGTKPGFAVNPIQALTATAIPESWEPFEGHINTLMEQVRRRFPSAVVD